MLLFNVPAMSVCTASACPERMVKSELISPGVMNHRQRLAEPGGKRGPQSRLSSRMTFLGVISWLSVCLILVGLFPEVSASLGGMWLMAGLFGLAAAVGLGEAAKAELRLQNDMLSNYLSEARTDALTGLGNRRAFDGGCRHWLEEWRRGRGYALLLIDVDRFKLFNDRYGHQAGDEMLRAVARILKLQSAGHGTAIRYGGEEFAVILPGHTLEQAITWADAVRERISTETIFFRNVTLNVTVSIGVAVSQPTDTPDNLVVRADEQLYLAKASGRNCTRPAAAIPVHLERLLADMHAEPLVAEQR